MEELNEENKVNDITEEAPAKDNLAELEALSLSVAESLKELSSKDKPEDEGDSEETVKEPVKDEEPGEKTESEADLEGSEETESNAGLEGSEEAESSAGLEGSEEAETGAGSETTDETKAETEDNSSEIAGNITLKASWYPEDRAELEAVIYNHAADVSKKGDKPDFVMLMCAGIAMVCFIVMLVTGIKGEFTPVMIALLCCYVIIAVLCLMKPLHVKLSNKLWNKGFEKKFLVNKGCDEEIILMDNALMYKGKDGAYNQFLYEELEGIYESENYIIFHRDDYRIFAVKTVEMDENLKNEVVKRVSK